LRGGIAPRAVLLHPEGHDSLRADADVDDVRAADDVDGLVAVFGDVVGAGAVELDERVVDGVVERAFDVGADERDGVREGQEGRGLVGWVAVYWVALWGASAERMGCKEVVGSTYLPSSSTCP
jgi:hypothetical protein